MFGPSGPVHTQALAVHRQPYWIGLDDLETEGEFTWSTAGPAGPPVPAFWDAGQP